MFVKYSQTASWSEALQKTFDGKNPCSLCKVVSEGKQAEKKQEAKKLETKLDLACFDADLLLVTPEVPARKFSFITHPSVRAEAPPVPPPRIS